MGSLFADEPEFVNESAVGIEVAQAISCHRQLTALFAQLDGDDVRW